MASLRDQVLATIGDKMKQEREAMAAKAAAKAEGKAVPGERGPKVKRSQSGNFFNIRHTGEFLLLAIPDITPGAFAQYIHTEWPESQAGSKSAIEGKELGHYPYYRRYVLDNDIKFKEEITEQLKAEGLDFATQLAEAQKMLEETISRRKKPVE